MKKVKKIKTFRYLKKLSFWYVFFIGLFIFLMANIFYSQNISLVYINLINNQPKAAITFLKTIKKTRFFESELKKLTHIFGPSVKTLVFTEEKIIDEKIKTYQQLLLKNPNSRNLLYNLYQLYQKKGDQKIALEYLKQVKKIDPFFK